MQFISLPIPSELKSSVESVFLLTEYSPEHDKERLVPDGRQSLIIELDHQPRYVYESAQKQVHVKCVESWLSGIHDSSLVFSTPPNASLLAVRFLPAGLYEYLSSDVSDFANRVLPARPIFGDSISQLRQHLLKGLCLENSDPHILLESVAQWLLSAKKRSGDPIIQQAVSRIIENPTETRVNELVEQQPHSHKHFLRRFTEHVGLSPKRLQRILRFNQIFQRIQQNERVQWASISADCGYYDQAHFIREFKNFSGINPEQYLSIDTDRQNFFPER